MLDSDIVGVKNFVDICFAISVHFLLITLHIEKELEGQ